MQRQRWGIHAHGALLFPIRDMGEERWEECLNDVLVHHRNFTFLRSSDFGLPLGRIFPRDSIDVLKTDFSTRSGSGEFINEWF